MRILKLWESDDGADDEYSSEQSEGSDNEQKVTLSTVEKTIEDKLDDSSYSDEQFTNDVMTLIDFYDKQ